MQQNHDSPTPQQLEAIKKATAFAFGYSYGLSQSTNLTHYGEQAKRLREDLIAFGVMKADGVAIPEPYFQSYLDGLTKAERLIESISSC